MKKFLVYPTVIALLFGLFLLSYQKAKVQPSIPQEQFHKPQANSVAVSRKDQIKIGFTSMGDFEYIQILNNYIQAEAKKQGVDLRIYEDHASSGQLVNDVKDMIKQHVDVIILNPMNESQSIQAVQLASQAKIPVVGVTSISKTDLLTTYIGSNDIQAGQIVMQFMAERLGEHGNIVILQGLPEQSSQIQRALGVSKVLERYPNIKVLKQQNANWSSDEAYTLMKGWYKTFGGKIDGVIAMNDNMAMGALKYLDEIGLKGKIPVVGIDGIPEALNAIKSGALTATLIQDAKGQAKMAVDVAMTIARNGHVAKSYFIPYQLVTSDNVNQYSP